MQGVLLYYRPNIPLHIALPILVAAPSVHQASCVEGKAVPPACGHLCNLHASQRSHSPGLALMLPVNQTIVGSASHDTSAFGESLPVHGVDHKE